MQVEFHPALNQKELIKFCKLHDIVLTAYSSLRKLNVANKTTTYFFYDKIKGISDKYNKKAVQVALRYLLIMQ